MALIGLQRWAEADQVYNAHLQAIQGDSPAVQRFADSRLQALLAVGCEQVAGVVEGDPVAQGGEDIGQAPARGIVHQRRAGGGNRDAGGFRCGFDSAAPGGVEYVGIADRGHHDGVFAGQLRQHGQQFL